MTPDEISWDAVNIDGLVVPVPSEWHQAYRGGPYIGQHGRLDIRRAESDLVDPARLASLSAALGAEIRTTIAKVSGRAAIKATGAESITYVIPHNPRRRGPDIVLEETRVVYAIPPAWATEVVRRLEQDSTSMLQELCQHMLGPDGHLAFGPVRVPAGWKLVMEDGSLQALASEHETEAVEIDVGGGSIKAVSDGDGVGEFQFRPVPLNGSSIADMYDELLRDLSDELKPIALIADRLLCDHSATNFTSSVAGMYELRLQDSGLTRRGYFWRDILGYPWELSYTMSQPNWVRYGHLWSELGRGPE